MAESQLTKTLTLNDKCKHFLNYWHQFPIDYWWRKKYNVPFGSSLHREMNWIDMYIEFQEELEVTKMMYDSKEIEDAEEDELLGLTDTTGKKTVKMSQEDIDDSYDNLDLSQFDK